MNTLTLTRIEQIKDPRWQRKRLEILSRDSFTCCDCGDTKNQLHVHHSFYISGRDYWDYPGFSLTTLCATCHSLRNGFNNEFWIQASDGMFGGRLQLTEEYEAVFQAAGVSKKYLFSVLILNARFGYPVEKSILFIKNTISGNPNWMDHLQCMALVGFCAHVSREEAESTINRKDDSEHKNA